MIIGFTGTRNGMTVYQRQVLTSFLTLLHPEEFHHGDCVGSDAEADGIARSLGIPIVIHPPTNPKARAYCYRDGDTQLPEEDYLDRNMKIVEQSDFMLAAPDGPETLRSGTWSTVRYSVAVGKPVTILYK
jgi:hypothetical protein